MQDSVISAEGGCSCGKVRYKLENKALVVHCCHCLICQRQTGTAFALNALFDASNITLLQGELSEHIEATPSGKGQTITRCCHCKVAVWSHYFMGGIKEKIRFLRVGTLDNPNVLPPDVHIFAASKQSWVSLPENAKVYEVFYEFEKIWSVKDNQHRLRLLQMLES